MPSVAQIVAIPRRYAKPACRRYGFHGLSYAYLMEELERLLGREAAAGRVILAHLGSGHSLAAVHELEVRRYHDGADAGLGTGHGDALRRY